MVVLGRREAVPGMDLEPRAAKSPLAGELQAAVLPRRTRPFSIDCGPALAIQCA